MSTVPLMQDDFGDEFNDNTSSANRLKHPYVTFFHICFRTLAIIVYLFSNLFTDSFITCFVFIILLLSADFWTVKNITGRILVGLRWWNYIDDDGKSIWVYEARDKSQISRHNAQEVRIFWMALVIVPVLWSFFFVVALFGLRFKWLVLVMIALTLSGANLHGYVKCKFGSNIKDSVKAFGQRELLKNFLSRAQPPVNQPNNTTGIV